MSDGLMWDEEQAEAVDLARLACVYDVGIDYRGNGRGKK